MINSLVWTQIDEIYCEEINTILKQSGTFPFGISSGDPSSSSVFLCTTLNPFQIKNKSGVRCQLSEREDFKEVYREFTAIPSETNAFSVKIYAYGLAEYKTYYYRFIYGEAYSDVGITKTLPANPDHLSFAVVSCSNYEWGYFNAYEAIAKQKNLDFIIHLGDYIYEYGPGVYGAKDIARKHLPSHELLSLKDYRSRYAQYRLDPQLQLLHRSIPMISVWDDHEIANDAYKDGAQNHQAEEGSWETRKSNAQKAYFEWLPIADNTQNSVRRSFHMGSLMDLYMLDERLEGRTRQGQVDSVLSGGNNTMLGNDQLNWLTNEMKEHHSTWTVLGNQVLFSSLVIPEGINEIKSSNDMWDGYPMERDQLTNQWIADRKKDVLVLTGDAHCSFSIEMKIQDQVLGKEWVTPSVTSANLNERISNCKTKKIERKIKKPKINATLDFINLRDHGYMVVALNHEEATATWFKVNAGKSGKLKAKKLFKDIFLKSREMDKKA